MTLIRCPQCGYEKEVETRGRFKCSQCGTKFALDADQRCEVFTPNREGKLQGQYSPNQIPLVQRIVYSLFGVLIGGYALTGLLIGDFFIPSRRGLGSGAHLTGPSVWFLGLGLVCAAACLLLVVVDHYDTRDNERSYRFWGRSLLILSAGLCLIGIFFHMFQ